MKSVRVHSTGGHRIHLLCGFVSQTSGIVQLSTVVPRFAAYDVHILQSMHDVSVNFCKLFLKTFQVLIAFKSSRPGRLERLKAIKTFQSFPEEP